MSDNRASDNRVLDVAPENVDDSGALSSTTASHLVGAPSPSKLPRKNLGKRTSSTRSSRAAKKMAWGDLLTRVLFVAFLLALWQGAHWYLVVKTESWSGALFRSPLEVGLWIWNGFGLSYFTGTYEPLPGDPMPTTFWEAFRGSSYPPAVLGSLKRLMIGYGIAVAVGFPLGLAVAHWRLMDKTVGWMAVSLQSLPSICWIPLAQLWMGRFGEWPILFVTIMGALFATIVSVSDGIRQVSPILERAGKTLGAKGPRLYFGVLLPAALPGIVTGLKIAWSFAWRSLMAAELIVNTISLGNLLDVDRGNGDMEGVISTIIVIIVIGLGTQSLVFAPIERRLRATWGLSAI